MKQITSAEFKYKISCNPAWAATLTEPIEITDSCDMAGHATITHLSPFLHFTGHNSSGRVASFAGCHNLKTAEGHFAGRVNFNESGIEKIGDIHITQGDQNNIAASFKNCKNLKVAEGTYPGSVSFANTSIEKIGELTINKPNYDGQAASFLECRHLKVAEGTFLGYVDFRQSGIQKIGQLNITPSKDRNKADFAGCPNLKTAPIHMLTDLGFTLDEKVHRHTHQRERAKTAIANQPPFEI